MPLSHRGSSYEPASRALTNGRLSWPRRASLVAWNLLMRNRFAVALASLVWLVLRSGAQPRRMMYPCQQAAAANVGGWLLAFVPAAVGGRGRRSVCPKRRERYLRRAVAVGRTIFVASLLLLVFFGVTQAYHYVTDVVLATTVPLSALNNGTPIPATVAIAHFTNGAPTDAEIEALVQEAVANAGGIDSVVSPGDHVVIKPNLVQDGWGGTTGIVTDPRVVRAVVRLAQTAGAGQVTIAEGSASGRYSYGYTVVTPNAYRDAGYDTNQDGYDDETGVELVDLNDVTFDGQGNPTNCTQVTLSQPVIRQTYWVPNIILDCDVLISVPTLKNHSNGAVTMSLKNRVGTMPNELYHPDWTQQMKWSLMHSVTAGFPRDVPPGVTAPPYTETENSIVNYTIVDVNQVRPNDFAVVDGLVGITAGPVTLEPANPPMRLIIAGRDSVAVDAVGSLVMGYDPRYVLHIDWADRRGLGTMNVGTITVIGDHVTSVREDFPLNHGGAGITARADSTAPTITSMSPTNGTTVWGTVAVTGSGLSDNRGVVKAELYVDGEFVATNAQSPFAAFDWDSKTVADGLHTLTVYVYDDALNEASVSQTVDVYNDVVGPDWDHDSDVDVSDFAHFSLCFNGAGQPPADDDCDGLDTDGDADVDVADFAAFSRCFNGATQPPACEE